jgi:hypothetical protein
METLNPAPEISRPRTKYPIVWFVLVAVAAALRLGPIASGLPYSDYVDEGYTLHQVMEILRSKSLDVRWYGYPSLTSHLIAAEAIAYAPAYRYFHKRSFWKDLPREDDLHLETGDNYDLITPPELVFFGRFAIAVLSLGTVLLAGAVAGRLAGRRAGWMAMLLTALCPALVSRASNVIVDTVATFFVLLTLYWLERLRFERSPQEKPETRYAIYAGLSAGLAFGAKYTAGAVFAAVVVAILGLQLSKLMKARLLVFAGVALILAGIWATPPVVLHAANVVRDLRVIATNYAGMRVGPNYFSAALSSYELGIWLTGLGLAGMISMLWIDRTRQTALSWLAFVAVLLAPLVLAGFQPFRNVLPVVPVFCMAAAVFLIAATRWLERSGMPLGAGKLSTILALFVALPLGSSSWRSIRPRMHHIDTRVQAINWLQQHTTKEETVLGVRELSILPAEWNRITARSTVVPWLEAAGLLERQRFD